jgi:hypothetical protein
MTVREGDEGNELSLWSLIVNSLLNAYLSNTIKRLNTIW